MCYFLCWSLSDSPFWFAFYPIPDLYTDFTAFYSKFFHYHLTPCVIVCAERKWWVGVGWGFMGDVEVLAASRENLFWHAIYCANPGSNSESSSGSLSCRDMGSWSPRIICQYNLVTAIAIQLFAHKHTCKMVLSIFAAMSSLKLTVTTRASLPSIPSIEITNWYYFPSIVEVITMFIIIDFLPPIQERHNCLKFV